MMWIVGGVIVAFGAYELFIKPKAPVATVVPLPGSNATATQAQLPLAQNPLNQIQQIAQTVANMVNPPNSMPDYQAPPITQQPTPVTYVNQPPPSNYYVDTPVQQVDTSGTSGYGNMVDTTTPVYTPVQMDQADKQAYDSAMYAQYEASLSGVDYDFEV